MGRAKPTRAYVLAHLSDDDRLIKLARTSHYVSVWRKALADQAQRVDAAGIFKGSSEKWLWACALGGLLRTVRLSGDLGADITHARSAFKAAAPHAKDLRDVLEHLEDYELGLGHMPATGPIEMLQEMTDRDVDGLPVWENLTQLQGLDVEVNYRTAQTAADALAEATLHAIDDAKAALVAAGAKLPAPPPRPDLDNVMAPRNDDA